MGFDGSKIDALLADATANGVYPGVSAVAATADGVLYSGGAGPGVTEDQPYRVASMTKAMTTTAVLQLVDRGEVELDADVATYCPEIADVPLLEGMDGDEPVLRAPASAPTVRQLLNHTAGFGYSFINEKLAEYEERTGAPNPLAFAEGMFTHPLVNDPGTKWEYGINTDWAGRVVERVTGRTLEEQLRAEVWGPLGMDHTTFDPASDRVDRLLPIMLRQPDGSLVESGLDTPRPFEVCSGGGGSYSTAADYSRFLRMLLRGGELDGERILSAESVDLMFTPSLGGLPLPDVIRSSNPVLCNDIPSLPLPQDWGLGLHLTLADIPGLRSAGTGDWAGLTNCYYWADRTRGVCGAILTQVFPFFDEKVVMTAVGFESLVYAEVGAATPA